MDERPLGEGPWVRCPACLRPIRLWQNGDGRIDSISHESGVPCEWTASAEGDAWRRRLFDLFGAAFVDVDED